MEQQGAISEEELRSKKSEVLAAQVVAYRLLKLNKETAILCMQILAERKAAGSDFDYAKYIEEKLAESPKPTLDDKQKKMFRSILNLDFNKI